MGLKERVMELLRAADEERLDMLVASNRRALRYLLGRLWDPDEELRQRAARTLAAAAVTRPDFGKDVLRRLLWALNDESATNGVYGLAAIGEIGHRAPELVAPFVGPVAGYAWDDGLRAEILRALGRIAESAPELVVPHLESLATTIHDNRDEEQLLDRIHTLTRGSHDTN